MSLYQAVVLLLFNESERGELGFGEIKVGAGMGAYSSPVLCSSHFRELI